MVKQFSMELAGRTLTVEIGKVAAQANGAALMRYGDTVVLSTATASEKPREGIDFFPLIRERVRHLNMQFLHPVLLTVQCVHYSLKITEMM